MKDINELSPIKQRFRMVFESSGLTQVEFGRQIGKSQNLISDILNDRCNVSGDMIQLLRYKLNVNPDFLLKGSTPIFLKKDIDDLRIPVIADIPAGPWEDWIDSYAPGAGDDFLVCPDVHGKNLFAVRVKGDSMKPELAEGDILVIDPHKKFESGIAVVRHHWGYRIRNVKKITRDRWFLWPLNPAHESLEITPDNDTRLYVPVKMVSMRDI